MFCRKKGKTDHNLYSTSPIATPDVYIYIYMCAYVCIYIYIYIYIYIFKNIVFF